MKVQFSARLFDLTGKEIEQATKPGFLPAAHQELRTALEKIGCGPDILKVFDGLACEMRPVTIGDVVCASLMHGELRDAKKLVERLDMVRKIQNAEKLATPLEFADISDLAEMKKAVADGPTPILWKAQTCEALNGNVPEASPAKEG